MVLSISLVHPLQATPIQTWLFDKESSIRVGRATDNQVVLYSRVVSRHHLILEHLGHEWRLINLSANGTYWDDRLVSKAILRDSVLVRLANSGPTLRLQVLTPPPPSPSSTTLPPTFLAKRFTNTAV